jgi:hypothetical protein
LTFELGVVHLKEIQDATLPPSEHYIRYMADIPASSMQSHDEDDPEDIHSTSPFQIVICMTPQASKRLLQARYLQSDISFKRIVGFKEFELVSFDRHTRTSTTTIQIFMRSIGLHFISYCLLSDITYQTDGICTSAHFPED